MGCTSAKQVSSVPSDEEGQSKSHSNGDLVSGQSDTEGLILPPNSSCSFKTEGTVGWGWRELDILSKRRECVWTAGGGRVGRWQSTFRGERIAPPPPRNPANGRRAPRNRRAVVIVMQA